MSGELLHVHDNRIFTSLDYYGQGVVLHNRKDLIDRAMARLFRNCATIYLVTGQDDKGELVIKPLTVDKASLKRFLIANSDYASRSGSSREKLQGAYAEFLKRYREGVQERAGEFQGTKRQWSRFFGRLNEAGIDAPQTLRSIVNNLKDDHTTLSFEKKELLNRLKFAGFGPSQNIQLSKPVQQLIGELKANMETFKEEDKLHLACQFGGEDAVKRLIAAGADINAPNKDGETPLHVACRANQVDLAKLLIVAGADINAPNKDGETPLHVACRANQVDLAKLLIEKGADLSKVTNIGKETPFHSACRARNPEMVKLFFGKEVTINGKETPLSEIKDGNGSTPLHLACRVSNRETIAAFFDDAAASGADVNSKDANGDLPIHIACKEQDAALVQLLIDEGSTIDTPSGSTFYDPVNKEKKSLTPIELVRRQGNKAIELLLEAEEQKRTAEDTPLHAASRAGNEDAVKRLIKNGADINATNNHGETPLHSACRAGQAKIAALLIENKADLRKITTLTKETPFHSACRSRSPDVVRLFFGKTVTIDDKETLLSEIKDKNGYTPFHLACSVGDSETVDAFFDGAPASGADVNRKDDSGDLPIHIACNARNEKNAAIVELLINKESTIDEPSGSTFYDHVSREKKKLTPIEIVRRQGDEHIEWILEEAKKQKKAAKRTGRKL